jgi:predicted PurR-regulated permease PerM
MFAVTMTILGMPYVPLVSVLVAVTAFIPIVGAWVGCALGALFILVNDPMQAAAFVVMFLILQQIENNLIYPRVVGTSVGLPSMWTLAAVTVGADLMGVAGMVLMIPICSVLYTLLREITARRTKERGIDPDKLEDHPPVLKSKLKEKREHAKRRREAKKAAELAAMMKQKLHLPEHHDKK